MPRRRMSGSAAASSSRAVTRIASVSRRRLGQRVRARRARRSRRTAGAASPSGRRAARRAAAGRAGRRGRRAIDLELAPASARRGRARAARRSSAAGARRVDPARVAVVRERVQLAPRRAAEQLHERRLGELRDLADRVDPARVQLRRRLRPDAPQPLDRQRVEEVELAVGRDDEQPVGLGDAARDLGEELRARDADRDRQPDLARARARAAATAISSGVPGDAPQPARRRGTPRRSTAPRPAASCRRKISNTALLASE